MTPAALEALPFIVAAFAAATAVSFVLSPLAIRYARTLGAIDRPDAARRLHRLPVPRGGGLAVAATFVFVGVAALLLNSYVGAVSLVRITNQELAALFGGVALAAGLGFLDDRYELRARWQFAIQLGLAGVAITSGIYIGFVDNPIGFLGVFNADVIRFSMELGYLVTALWIVGMINSINFIDGLDGLSTGVALIAALTLGVLTMTSAVNLPAVTLLCAVLVGALAGFLPWNFHPARVFIGTTGVFAVGYALAVLSILGVAKVAVALLVLGVPIIDTFWVITRRLAAGRSPFTPDRGHFHHRLLDLGLTHRGAVLVIYGICGLLGVVSLLLSLDRSGPLYALYAFLGIVVGGGLVLYLLTRRAQDALDARTYAAEEPTEALTIEGAHHPGRDPKPLPRPNEPRPHERPGA